MSTSYIEKLQVLFIKVEDPIRIYGCHGSNVLFLFHTWYMYKQNLAVNKDLINEKGAQQNKQHFCELRG